MAGIESEDIGKIDECSICMQEYDQKYRQPKLLSCHHGFCLECLDSIARGKTFVDCPTCRQITHFPEGGVRYLQYNFYIDQLLQLKQLLLNESDDDTCTEHSKPFDFFCETCKVMVCSRCAVSVHKPHKVKHEADLIESLKRYVKDVQVKSDKAKSAVHVRRKNISELESSKECLSAKMKDDLQQVHQMFLTIFNFLRQKQEHMKEIIGAQYHTMSSKVDSEMENESFEITCLQNLSNLLDKAIQRQKPVVVTQMAKNAEIDARLAQLCQFTATKVDELNTKEIFESLQMLLQAIKDCVSTFVPATNAVPAQVIKIEASTAIAGLEANAEFQLKAKSSGLSAFILDPKKDVIPCNVEPTTGSSYQVRYRPQIFGEHTCFIKCFSLPVPEGEFKLQVNNNNPVKKIGTHGHAPGQLKNVLCVSLDAASNMYVSDRNNQRVQKFLSDGQYVTHWKAGGRDGKGYPGFLAVNRITNEIICGRHVTVESGEGRKYTATNILQIYDTSGDMKDEIAIQKMMQIGGITINNQQNQIICTDGSLNAIFILNIQCKVLKKVCGCVADPGRFINIRSVCVGPDGDIIVADTGNKRIKVLDRNCVYKHQFGCEGVGKGQFKGQISVSVDKDGHILVADSKRNDVQVFSYTGELLSCIDSSGDKMNCPLGLTVTDDHHVLVADFKNSCIKIYKYI